MSPIYTRPIREQLEHDRVIRQLQARYKRKHEVAINPGSEQNQSVMAGDLAVFPDLVLLSPENARRVEATVEVETAESVHLLEARAEWGVFSRLKVPFHLYVPPQSFETAKRICDEQQFEVSEIWTYHSGFDQQVRFTQAYKSSHQTKLRGPGPKTMALPKPVPKAAPLPAEKPAAVVVPSASPARKLATSAATPAPAARKPTTNAVAPSPAAGKPAAGAPTPAVRKAAARAAAPAPTPATRKSASSPGKVAPARTTKTTSRAPKPAARPMKAAKAAKTTKAAKEPARTVRSVAKPAKTTPARRAGARARR